MNRTALAALAAAALAGCSFGIDPDAELFTCSSDADCGEGYVCATPYSNEEGRPLASRCVESGSCVTAALACNGGDDDCDGEVDEADEIEGDLVPLRSTGERFSVAEADCRVADATLQGVCGEGRAACVDGVARCRSLGNASAGDDDDCDGLDDDCNGAVDEDIDATTDANCGGCGLDPEGNATVHQCRVEAGTRFERCENGVCIEALCANAGDDDEDGLTDCEDPDCDGQVCGAGSGFVCVIAEGQCLCGAEVETDCGDNFDNDCNGRQDCRDRGCLGRGCNGADPTVNCGNLGCVARESVCDDGQDDDADEATDCDDLDCQRRRCGPGQNCGNVGGVPTCVPEEAACGDGLDDDGDGLTDCDDDDCLGDDCSADPLQNCGQDAAGDRACVARELACDDATDDDGDGRGDCADADCEGDACGVGCLCQGGLALEVDCGNQADDDRDGQGDCADLGDCLGESCGAGCACVDDAGVGRALENDCGDDLDNDRDGQADCDDPDCAGQDCTADGGPACVCELCPGGVCPPGEVQCEDALDNDGDGLANCADPDCDGLRCLTTEGCVCAAGFATESATACADGEDDDADGAMDCADGDCDGDSCGAGCECGGGVRTEAAAACADGADNDGDGSTDCADADCDGDSCGQGCLCGGGVRTEAPNACGNVADDDGDGLIDCADPDCDADACGNGCLCAGGARIEATTACGDAADNDGDGQTDCADANCDAQPCGSGVAPIDPTDCLCVAGIGVEQDCGNFGDDDRDGQIDCSDADCAGVAPCPVVDAVTPVTGPAASCGGADPLQAITISGRNFATNAAGQFTGILNGVFLGNTACLNVIVRDLGGGATEIDCETALSTPGRVDVRVENTGGFTGTLAGGWLSSASGSNLDRCDGVTTTLSAAAGATTPDAIARITEVGLTEGGAAPAGVLVGEIGWGPAGTDPACDPGWVWSPIAVDAAVEPQSYDEYRGGFAAPAVSGTYGFIVRITRTDEPAESGLFEYCDTNIAANGVQVGTLTVP